MGCLHAIFDLAFVELLDLADGVHGLGVGER